MIQISILLTLEIFIEISKVFLIWKVFSKCLSYFKLIKLMALRLATFDKFI
jgi:hypothetical protein